MELISLSTCETSQLLNYDYEALMADIYSVVCIGNCFMEQVMLTLRDPSRV